MRKCHVLESQLSTDNHAAGVLEIVVTHGAIDAIVSDVDVTKRAVSQEEFIS